MPNNIQKIIILTLFLISNLCTFLISTTEDEIPNENFSLSELRIDYIKVVISGKLKTQFNTLEPMVLTNSAKTLYIPNVFLHNELKDEDLSVSLNNEATNSSKYLVSLHKSYLNEVLTNNHFEILPYIEKEIILKRKKVLNYEIAL